MYTMSCILVFRVFVLNSNIIDIVQLVITGSTRKHPANVTIQFQFFIHSKHQITGT